MHVVTELCTMHGVYDTFQKQALGLCYGYRPIGYSAPHWCVLLHLYGLEVDTIKLVGYFFTL